MASTLGAPALPEAAPRIESAVLSRALERYRPLLRALAIRLTRSDEDADDLVQDVFERALSRPQMLPAVERLRPWLITVLNNLFVDGCRRRKRRPRPEPLVEPESLPNPTVDEPPVWSQMSGRDLREAVADLDERFRTVYVMYALEGKTYAEIARTTGLSPSTIGTRLLRARTKLKAILESRLDVGGAQ